MGLCVFSGVECCLLVEKCHTMGIETESSYLFFSYPKVLACLWPCYINTNLKIPVNYPGCVFFRR